MYIVQNARVAGGIETHVDFRVEEIFENYRISSVNEDKIAVKLEPGLVVAGFERIDRVGGAAGGRETHQTGTQSQRESAAVPEFYHVAVRD
jgi:hypothetical protein